MSYIVDFEKHFANSKVVKLNLNYRSTQNIVGASNEVIKHNKFKVEKELQHQKNLNIKLSFIWAAVKKKIFSFALTK